MSGISEERLRQAVCEAGDLLDASLPDADQCSHEFSPAFTEKMDRLLHRRKRRTLYRNLQRAACLFLIFLLGSAVLLSTNAQARQVVFGWVREKVEDAQQYFHQGPVTPAEDIVAYQITVPEEYHLDSGMWMETNVNEYYLNEDALYISFSYLYETINSGGNLFIMDEGAEKKTVSVHGMQADLYLSFDPAASNTLVWFDTNTGALLEVSAFLDEDALIALAETVTPRDKAELSQCQIGAPTGYQWVSEWREEGFFQQSYHNPDTDAFFTVSYQSETTPAVDKSLFPPAGTESKAVVVQNTPAKLYWNYPDKGTNTLVWRNQATQTKIVLQANRDEGELLAIATGLTSCPN